jgi:hypothetical protein
MVIGFLWYSPVLFGNVWVKQIGKKMEDMSGGGPLTYILTALTALIGSYILALLLTLMDERTIGAGLTMGLTRRAKYISQNWHEPSIRRPYTRTLLPHSRLPYRFLLSCRPYYWGYVNQSKKSTLLRLCSVDFFD